MKKNIKNMAYAVGNVIRAITSMVLATRMGCGGSFLRTCTKHVCKLFYRIMQFSLFVEFSLHLFPIQYNNK